MAKFRTIASLCALGLCGFIGVSEAAPCEFATQSADVTWVNVQPTGGTPFRLLLDKRPLTATPMASGSSTIEVDAPLRFTATQRTSQLGARLAKRTSIAGGRIVLARGLAPNFSAVESAEFESATEAGSIPVALPLLGFSTKDRLDLPCSAVDISWTASAYDAPLYRLPKGPLSFVDTREPILLYKDRELVDPLEIRFGSALVVVARRGKWVRLRARWSDGSVLQGWAEAAAVTVQRGSPKSDLVQGGMVGFGGGCGGGHRRQEIPLKLHSHAPIHDSAGGEIWAQTAGTITVHAFPLTRSDGWIQISKVDGLPTGECAVHNRIWVHAEHVLWSKTSVRR